MHQWLLYVCITWEVTCTCTDVLISTYALKNEKWSLSTIVFNKTISCCSNVKGKQISDYKVYNTNPTCKIGSKQFRCQNIPEGDCIMGK